MGKLLWISEAFFLAGFCWKGVLQYLTNFAEVAVICFAASCQQQEEFTWVHPFFALASKTCNNHSHIYLSIVGQSWLSNIIAFCCRCSSFFDTVNHRGASSRQVLHHWWDPLKSWPAACKNCMLWYCSNWIFKHKNKQRYLWVCSLLHIYWNSGRCALST